MATESRLLLISGPDQALRIAALSLGLLSVAGLLFAPAEPVAKAAGLLISLAALCFLMRYLERLNEGRISIFSDGSADWVNPDSQSRKLSLNRHHWVSSRYALVCASSRRGRHCFLISRSLQFPGHYQMTSSWLRLGAWDPKQELL